MILHNLNEQRLNVEDTTPTIICSTDLSSHFHCILATLILLFHEGAKLFIFLPSLLGELSIFQQTEVRLFLLSVLCFAFKQRETETETQRE